MYKLRLLVVTLLFLAPAILLAGETSDEAAPGTPPMPTHLEAEHNSAWAAATALTDPSDRGTTALVLRKEFEHTVLGQKLLQHIRQTAPPYRWGMSGFFDYLYPPQRKTLRDAVNRADFIMRGRVTGRSAGFYLKGGAIVIPGQLLRIAPVEVLADSYHAQGQYYLFVHAGTVHVGSLDIEAMEPVVGEVPRLGAEVLLVVPFGQRFDARLIECLTPETLISLQASIRLDHVYSSEQQAELSADALLGEVRRLLTEKPR